MGNCVGGQKTIEKHAGNVFRNIDWKLIEQFTISQSGTRVAYTIRGVGAVLVELYADCKEIQTCARGFVVCFYKDRFRVLTRRGFIYGVDGKFAAIPLAPGNYLTRSRIGKNGHVALVESKTGATYVINMGTGNYWEIHASYDMICSFSATEVVVKPPDGGLVIFNLVKEDEIIAEPRSGKGLRTVIENGVEYARSPDGSHIILITEEKISSVAPELEFEPGVEVKNPDADENAAYIIPSAPPPPTEGATAVVTNRAEMPPIHHDVDRSKERRFILTINGNRFQCEYKPGDTVCWYSNRAFRIGNVNCKVADNVEYFKYASCHVMNGVFGVLFDGNKYKFIRIDSIGAHSCHSKVITKNELMSCKWAVSDDRIVQVFKSHFYIWKF